MTIKNFKNFMKDHKKKVIVISGCALVGSIAFAITRKKPEFDSDVTWKDLQSKYEVKGIADYLKVTEEIANESGATTYVPVHANEIGRLLGDDTQVVDPSGIVLDVSGAIIFGKPVENKT